VVAPGRTVAVVLPRSGCLRERSPSPSSWPSRLRGHPLGVSSPNVSVYVEIVRSALEELSDSDYQHRVWTGGGGNEMSSFEECVERLFGDSGLSVAGSVTSPFTDRRSMAIYGHSVILSAGSRRLEALTRSLAIPRWTQFGRC
jgi:hypothetical protein